MEHLPDWKYDLWIISTEFVLLTQWKGTEKNFIFLNCAMSPQSDQNKILFMIIIVWQLRGTEPLGRFVKILFPFMAIGKLVSRNLIFADLHAPLSRWQWSAEM